MLARASHRVEVRIVLELSHEEFELVNRASHSLGPSEYLKRIVLE
jgi:hypothetical protein